MLLVLRNQQLFPSRGLGSLPSIFLILLKLRSSHSKWTSLSSPEILSMRLLSRKSLLSESSACRFSTFRMSRNSRRSVVAVFKRKSLLAAPSSLSDFECLSRPKDAMIRDIRSVRNCLGFCAADFCPHWPMNRLNKNIA